MLVKCHYCQKEFNRKPSEMSTGHNFCSQECYRFYKPTLKPCPQCGKPMLRKCKACNYTKWVNNNPEKRKNIDKNYNQRYKAKNSNWKQQMMNHISQNCCLYCGERDITTLCFHHRNPEEKSFGLVWAYQHYYSIKTMKVEAEKCDVVCANCHLKIHATEHEKQSENWGRKRNLLKTIGKECCEKCGNDDIRALSFHHKHDKLFLISGYYNYSIDVNLEDVIIEVSKCDLLCENCHRKEHFISYRNKE